MNAWLEFTKGNPELASQIFAENGELDYFGRIIRGKTNIAEFLKGFKRYELEYISKNWMGIKCTGGIFSICTCAVNGCSWEIYFNIGTEYEVGEKRVITHVKERLVEITLNHENLVERAKVSKRQNV